MSLTQKDMVFGTAAAAAFLGLVVYNQHKFNKLHAEIAELREETKTLAQYIKILESKVAGDFQTILSSHDSHHHHHVHAGHSQEPQPVNKALPANTQPALEEAKPEVPIIPESRKPVAQPVRSQAERPVRQPVKHAPPPAVKRAPPAVKRAPPPKRNMPIEEPSESVQEEDSNDGSDDESSVEEAPMSNRRSAPPANSSNTTARNQPAQINRPRSMVPRAASTLNTAAQPPSKPQHVITVEEGKVPKGKEEEDSYNPAEDNNRAAEISGGRPTPPKANGPRTSGPKSGGADKKRFGPKTDDSEDSEMRVNSNKVKGKSILKNPSSGTLNNGDSKHLNGEKENSIDADLADDMALVAAKSSKRMEDNEGREVGQTEARNRMAKTAQIAEAMRKKAEQRVKVGESPST